MIDNKVSHFLFGAHTLSLSNHKNQNLTLFRSSARVKPAGIKLKCMTSSDSSASLYFQTVCARAYFAFTHQKAPYHFTPLTHLLPMACSLNASAQLSPFTLKDEL